MTVFVCYGYQFCLFLLFFYWILKLFQTVYYFSVGFWNCSRLCTIFLLDFETVPDCVLFFCWILKLFQTVLFFVFHFIGAIMHYVFRYFYNQSQSIFVKWWHWDWLMTIYYGKLYKMSQLFILFIHQTSFERPVSDHLSWKTRFFWQNGFSFKTGFTHWLHI